jgi:hypothetical protein
MQELSATLERRLNQLSSAGFDQVRHDSKMRQDKSWMTNCKTNDELQERINVDLENVHQWLLANKLTL